MGQADTNADFSKEKLLSEYQFLIDKQTEIFNNTNSNRLAIQEQYKNLAMLLNRDLDKIENLIDFDLCLTKINTYIAMAEINEQTDHELHLRYLTRLPSLLFKLHLNKLMIVEKFYLEGSACYLSSLPLEFGYLAELQALSLEDCALSALPETLVHLKKLKQINLKGNLIQALPESMSHVQITL